MRVLPINADHALGSAWSMLINKINKNEKLNVVRYERKRDEKVNYFTIISSFIS